MIMLASTTNYLCTVSGHEQTEFTVHVYIKTSDQEVLVMILTASVFSMDYYNTLPILCLLCIPFLQELL